MTTDLSPAILTIWSRRKSLTPEQWGDAPEIVVPGWSFRPGFWTLGCLSVSKPVALQATDLDAALWRLMRLVAWEKRRGVRKGNEYIYVVSWIPPVNGAEWHRANPADWITAAEAVVGRMEAT